MCDHGRSCEATLGGIWYLKIQCGITFALELCQRSSLAASLRRVSWCRDRQRKDGAQGAGRFVSLSSLYPSLTGMCDRASAPASLSFSHLDACISPSPRCDALRCHPRTCHRIHRRQEGFDACLSLWTRVSSPDFSCRRRFLFSLLILLSLQCVAFTCTMLSVLFFVV